MSKLLDSIDFTFDCPKCGKQIKEKLGRLYRHRHATCRTCGRFTLNVEIQTRISRAIQELERQSANLTKGFKIKL